MSAILTVVSISSANGFIQGGLPSRSVPDDTYDRREARYEGRGRRENIEVWLSLVERLLGVQEAVGSNPATSTICMHGARSSTVERRAVTAETGEHHPSGTPCPSNPEVPTRAE